MFVVVFEFQAHFTPHPTFPMKTHTRVSVSHAVV
jgi:hypothetical protein